jgi:hypothetical protein
VSQVTEVATTASTLARVRRTVSDEMLRLAYHAALPVVVDVGLLNLLRVNFFLDPPDALPFEAEATLLLSPLFREIGNGLYEMAPEVRNILLVGLQTSYGSERVRQVALLLEQYSTPAWGTQPELEQAQQLTALSFVDPARAARWLEGAHTSTAGSPVSREWFVAMRRRLAAQPQVGSAPEEIAKAIRRLDDKRLEVRLSAIRVLSALAQLPGTDITPAVNALLQLLPGDNAPDAQAAQTLLRTLGVTMRTEVTGAVPADLKRRDTSEPDPRAPVFFLSYARSPDAELDARARHFFDDLSENVAQLVSRPVGSDPGFMDAGLLAGSRWNSELLTALGTCQVFVPLLSVPYVESQWSSMEWDAFSRRTVVSRTAQGLLTGILPVNWKPVPPAKMPAVIAGVQGFAPKGLDRHVADRYATRGLVELLTREFESDYRFVVWRLAQEIANFYFNYRVEPLILSDYELRDVFREQPS